jgi:hypothetical protein
MKQLCNVGGNVQLFQHHGKQFGSSSEINTPILYDPAFLSLLWWLFVNVIGPRGTHIKPDFLGVSVRVVNC